MFACFSIVGRAFDVMSRIPIKPQPARGKKIFPIFCLKIFIFRSVICFEFIFVQDGVNIEPVFLLILMSDYSNAIY